MQRDGVPEPERADRGALEVMAAFPGLDHPHGAGGSTDCEWEAGDPGAGAQIRDRIGGRQDLAQCRGLEQQPLRDRERTAMAGQIDAPAPLIEQQRELLPAPQRLGLAIETELVETLAEDPPQLFHVERFHVERSYSGEPWLCRRASSSSGA